MEEGVSSFNGIDVKLGGRGRNQVGSLNFEVALFNKKTPYGLDRPGPQPKRLLLVSQSPLLL
jgi:hypothetical protein